MPSNSGRRMIAHGSIEKSSPPSYNSPPRVAGKRVNREVNMTP